MSGRYTRLQKRFQYTRKFETLLSFNLIQSYVERHNEGRALRALQPVNQLMTKLVEKYENTRQWSEKIAWTGMACPGAMALYTDPDGSIFVVICEVHTHSIRVINKSTSMVVHSWGGFGSDIGQLNSPLGISVSEQGTIGVCDSRNDRIQFFEIDGTFLMEYHDHVHYPVSIAFIHTNNVVIAEQDNIQVRNSIGQILYLVGSSGVAPGMLSSPMGLSTTTKGNIFVCDTKNHRVQVFSKYGRLRCTLGEGKLKFPFAISVLSTGEIYVLDMRGVVNGFRIFLAEKDDKIFGITIFHFLEKKEGEKVGGIAVSENGDLALSIYTKNKVVMYKNYNINKLGDTDDKLTITKYMDSTTNQILDGNVVLKLWIP